MTVDEVVRYLREQAVTKKMLGTPGDIAASLVFDDVVAALGSGVGELKEVTLRYDSSPTPCSITVGIDAISVVIYLC